MGRVDPFQYFTDHQDAELGRLVSEGRRREFAAFGWDPADVPDPQDPATFERSKLRWDEFDREPHRTLLRWHRELITLRARTSALRSGDRGDVSVEFDEDARWLVMRRAGIVVACNWGENPVELPVRVNTVLVSNGPSGPADSAVRLQPDGVLVGR